MTTIDPRHQQPAPSFQDRYVAAPYPQGPYQPVPGTNVLAVVGLIAAFPFPLVGIGLGIAARRQIARTGEKGGPLAAAAIVIGSVFTAFAVLIFTLVLACGSFSASFSTDAVSASTLENQIAVDAGVPASSVDCSSGLPATVGATTTCTATTDDGSLLLADVVVTSAEGDDIGYTFTFR